MRDVLAAVLSALLVALLVQWRNASEQRARWLLAHPCVKQQLALEPRLAHVCRLDADTLRIGLVYRNRCEHAIEIASGHHNGSINALQVCGSEALAPTQFLPGRHRVHVHARCALSAASLSWTLGEDERNARAALFTYAVAQCVH